MNSPKPSGPNILNLKDLTYFKRNKYLINGIAIWSSLDLTLISYYFYLLTGDLWYFLLYIIIFTQLIKIYWKGQYFGSEVNLVYKSIKTSCSSRWFWKEKNILFNASLFVLICFRDPHSPCTEAYQQYISQKVFKPGLSCQIENMAA